MKKMFVFLMVMAAFISTKALAEEAKAPKAKPVKDPKVVEAKILDSDIKKLTAAVDAAVKEAVIAKQGPGGFEYTAKKMKPPKNEKWIEKWNELGAEGWDYIDHFENIYIFKRAAMSSMVNRIKPAASPEKAEPAAVAAPALEEGKKAKVSDDKAAKKAQKEQDKAAKKAEKEQKAAQKKADKEAKKAEKEQEKAAKKAAKQNKKTNE